MSEKRRFIYVAVIMTVLVLATGTVAITGLYSTALFDSRARLTETAQSQARLIEAMARHDSVYEKDTPGGPEKATLSQIMNANERLKGFGETGEYSYMLD